MIGLLLILSASCLLSVKIPRYDTFHFTETYKRGDLLKIELKEVNNIPVKFKLTNTGKGVIFDSKYNNCTLFTTISEDETLLRFKFTNTTNSLLNLKTEVTIVTPDNDNTITDENEILSELRRNLESIIVTQKEHLYKETGYENMVKASKRAMILLLVCECLFCILVVYYLNRETIKLFENKRQI